MTVHKQQSTMMIMMIQTLFRKILVQECQGVLMEIMIYIKFQSVEVSRLKWLLWIIQRDHLHHPLPS